MPTETWTFVTNHGHVFLCIASDPEIRLKEVADRARDELLSGISKEEMNMATTLLDRVRDMADRIR